MGKMESLFGKGAYEEAKLRSIGTVEVFNTPASQVVGSASAAKPKQTAETQSIMELYGNKSDYQARLKSLRQAAGIPEGMRYTDWYSTRGKAPKGFEIESQLMLRSEAVQTDYENVLEGRKGFETFLYENYGEDILKRDGGYEFDNAAWWLNRFKNGVYDDPRDSGYLMQQVLQTARTLFSMEEFASDIAGTTFTDLAGQELDGKTAQEAFGNQYDDLAEVLGGWDNLVKKYRAGMLSSFNPVLYDEKGKAKYYLHSDGILYAVDEVGAGKNTAIAYYNTDGTLDRISVNEGGVIVDGFSAFGAGLVNGFLDILDLGAIATAGIGALFGGDFIKSYEEYKVFRSGLGFLSGDSGIYQADNRIIADGEVEWDNLIYGALNVAGNITSMLFTMGVTKALGKIGKAGTTALTKMQTELADEALEKAIKAGSRKAVEKVLREKFKDLAKDQVDDLVTKVIKSSLDDGTAMYIDDIVKLGVQGMDEKAARGLIEGTISRTRATYLKEAADMKMNKVLQKYAQTQIVRNSKTTTVGKVAKGLAAKKFLNKTFIQIPMAIPSKLVSFNAGIPVSKWAQTNAWGNVFEKAFINLAADGALIYAELKGRQTELGYTDQEVWRNTLWTSVLNAGLTLLLSGGTDDVGAVNRYKQLFGGKKTSQAALKAIAETTIGKGAKSAWRATTTSWIMDVMENTMTMASKMNVMSGNLLLKDGTIDFSNFIPDFNNPQQLSMTFMSSAMSWYGFAGSEGMRSHSVTPVAEGISKSFDAISSKFLTEAESAYRSFDEAKAKSYEKARDALLQSFQKHYESTQDVTAAQILALDEMNTAFKSDGSGVTFVVDEVEFQLGKQRYSRYLLQQEIVYANFKKKRIANKIYMESFKNGSEKGFHPLKKLMAKNFDRLSKKLEAKMSYGYVDFAQSYQQWLDRNTPIQNPTIKKQFNELDQDFQPAFDKMSEYIEFTHLEDDSAFDPKVDTPEVRTQKMSETDKTKTQVGRGPDEAKPRVYLKPGESKAILSHYEGDANKAENAVRTGIVMEFKLKNLPGADNGQAEVAVLNKSVQAMIKLVGEDTVGIIWLGKNPDDPTGSANRYLIVPWGKTNVAGLFLVDAIGKWLKASTWLTQGEFDADLAKKSIEVMTELLDPGKDKQDPNVQVGVIDQLLNREMITSVQAVKIIKQLGIKQYDLNKVQYLPGSKLGRSVQAVEAFDELRDMNNRKVQSKDTVYAMMRLIDLITGDTEIFKDLTSGKGAYFDAQGILELRQKLKDVVAANPLRPSQELLKSLQLASTSSLDFSQLSESELKILIEEIAQALGVNVNGKFLIEGITYNDTDGALLFLGGNASSASKAIINEMIHKGLLTPKNKAIPVDEVLSIGISLKQKELDVKLRKGQITKAEYEFQIQEFKAYLIGRVQNLHQSPVSIFGRKIQHLKNVALGTDTNEREANYNRALESAGLSKGGYNGLPFIIKNQIRTVQELLDAFNAAYAKNPNDTNVAAIYGYINDPRNKSVITRFVNQSTKKYRSVDAITAFKRAYQDRESNLLGRKVRGVPLSVEQSYESGKYLFEPITPEGIKALEDLGVDVKLNTRTLILERIKQRVEQRYRQDVASAIIRAIETTAVDTKLTAAEVIEKTDFSAISTKQKDRLRAAMLAYNELRYGGNRKMITTMQGGTTIRIDLTTFQPKGKIDLENKIDLILDTVNSAPAFDGAALAQEIGLTPGNVLNQVRYMQMLLNRARLNKNPFITFNINDNAGIISFFELMGYDPAEVFANIKNGSNIPGVEFHKAPHDAIELIPLKKKEGFMESYKQEIRFIEGPKGKGTSTKSIEMDLFEAFGLNYYFDEDTLINPQDILAIALNDSGIIDQDNLISVLSSMEFIKASKSGKTGGGTKGEVQLAKLANAIQMPKDTILDNTIMIMALRQKLSEAYEGTEGERVVEIKSAKRLKALQDFGWQLKLLGGDNYYIESFDATKPIPSTSLTVDGIIPGNLLKVKNFINDLYSSKYFYGKDSAKTALYTAGDYLQQFAYNGDYSHKLGNLLENPTNKIEVNNTLTTEAVDLTSGKLRDVLAQLKDPKYKNNLIAIMAIRQIETALHYTKTVRKAVSELGYDPVLVEKIDKIMSAPDVRDIIAKSITDTSITLDQINRVIASRASRTPAMYSLQYSNRSANDFDPRTNDMAVMNGSALARLNPDYADEIKGMKLTQEELDYVKNKISSIFVDPNVDDYLDAESNSITKFLSLITSNVDEKTGQYHYGFALDNLVRLDPFEFENDIDLKNYITSTFGQETYNLFKSKMDHLKTLHQNANIPLKNRGLRVEQPASGSSFSVDQKKAIDPDIAKGFALDSLKNKRAKREQWNMENETIQSSRALQDVNDVENDLQSAILNDVSKAAADVITAPSRLGIVNARNQIALGKMATTFIGLKNLIKKGFGPVRIADDAQAFELARQIYSLTHANQTEAEPVRYIILTQKKDGTVSSKLVTTERMRSDGEEDFSNLSLFRQLAMNDDPDSRQVILTMEKEEVGNYTYVNDQINREPEIRLNYILANGESTVIKDPTTGTQYAYSIRDFKNAVQVEMIAKLGKKYADAVGPEAKRELLADMLATTSNRYEIHQYIKEELSTMGVPDDMLDVLFFTAKDAALKNRTFSETESDIAFNNTVFRRYQGLYFKNQDRHMKRVLDFLYTGFAYDMLPEGIITGLRRQAAEVDFAKQSADRHYALGLIEGNQQIAPKLNVKDDADISRAANIIKYFMLKSDEASAINFVLKNASNSTFTYRDSSGATHTVNYDLKQLFDLRKSEPNYFLDLPGRKESVNLKDMSKQNVVVIDSEWFFSDKQTDAGDVMQIAFKSKRGIADHTDNIFVNQNIKWQDNPDYKGFEDFARQNGYLENNGLISQYEKSKVDKSAAIANIKVAIEDIIKKNPDVIFITHNGTPSKGFSDIAVLEKLLGNEMLSDGTKIIDFIKGRHIDWLNDVLRKFPILGVEGENKRQSIAAIIKRYENDPMLKEILKNLEGKQHDAAYDAKIMDFIIEKTSEGFFNVNKFNTEIVNKIDLILKELGLANDKGLVDETVFKKIADQITFGKDGFDAKDLEEYANRPMRTSEQIKKIIDLYNYEQLAKERTFKYKQQADQFRIYRRGFEEVLNSLRGNRYKNVQKVMGFLMNAIYFQKRPGENTGRRIDQSTTTYQDMITASHQLEAVLQADYGMTYDNGGRGLNLDSYKRMIKDMADDPETFVQKIIEHSQKSKSNMFDSNILTMDNFRSQGGAYGAGFADMFARLRNDRGRNKQSKFEEARSEYRQRDTFNRTFLPAKSMIEDTILSLDFDGIIIDDLKERLIRQMFTAFGYDHKKNYDPDKLKQRLNNYTYLDQKAEKVIEMAREEMPISFSRDRIYDMVTGFDKRKKIGQANVGSGSMVVNRAALKLMYGNLSYDEIRTNLNLKDGESLYISIVRHPSDKIHTIHGYKLIIDMDDNSIIPSFKMSVHDIFSKHSGDFDGDKIEILRPSRRIQELYSARANEQAVNKFVAGKTLQEVENHVYHATDALIEQLGIDDSTSTFEANRIAEKIQRYLATEIYKVSQANKEDGDIYRLINKTVTYEDLLQEKINKLAAMGLDISAEDLKKLWIEKVILDPMNPDGSTRYYVHDSMIHSIHKKAQINQLLYKNSAVRQALDDRNSIFRSVIYHTDEKTGVAEKNNYLNKTTPMEAALTKDKIAYTPLRFNDALVKSMDENIKVKGSNAVAEYKAILYQYADSDIVDALIEDGFKAYDVLSVLRIQDQRNRDSDAYFGLFKRVVKESGKTANQELDDLVAFANAYDELTKGVTRDISVGRSDAGLDQTIEYKHVIDSIVNEHQRKGTPSAYKPVDEEVILSGNSSYAWNNKFVVVDESLSGPDVGYVTRHFDENNPFFEVVQVPYEDGKPAVKGGMNIAQDEVTLIIKEHRLSEGGTKIAGASVGSFGKVTITGKDGTFQPKQSLTYTGADGVKTFSSDDIAMTISPQMEQKYFMKPAGIKAAEAIEFEYNGKKYKAYKMHLFVPEATATWGDKLKTGEADLLTIHHNLRTADSVIRFGNIMFKYDPETKQFIMSDKELVRAKQIREEVRSHDLENMNAVSLYHQLMLLHVLNAVDRKSLTPEGAAIWAREIEDAMRFNSYASDVVLAKINQIENNPLLFPGNSKQKLKTYKESNPFLRRLFSSELHDIIRGVQEVGVKEMFDPKTGKLYTEKKDVGGTISKRTDVSRIREEQGTTYTYADTENPVDMDFNKGVFGITKSYISVMDFMNYMLAGGQNKGQISKRMLLALVQNNMIGLGDVIQANYGSNWKPVNRADSMDFGEDYYRDLMVFKDPKVGAPSSEKDKIILASQGQLLLDKQIGHGIYDYDGEVREDNDILDFLDVNYREHNRKYLTRYEYDKKYNPNTKGNTEVAERGQQLSKDTMFITMMDAATRDLDDEADRIALFNHNTQTNSVSYNSMKELSLDDEGRAYLGYNEALPKEFQSLGELRKHTREAVASHTFYKIKDKMSDAIAKQTPIDQDPSTPNVMRLFNENLDDDLDLPTIDPSKKYYERLAEKKAGYMRIVNPESQAPETKPNYRSVTNGTPTEVKIDMLSSTGIDARDFGSSKIDEGIDKLKRVPRTTYVSLMSDIDYLWKRLGTEKARADFSKYVSIVAILSGLEKFERTEANIKLVTERLQTRFGIQSIEAAEKFISLGRDEVTGMPRYREIRKEEINLFYSTVTKLHKFSTDLAIKTKQPVPYLFDILYPMIESQTKGLTPPEYRWTLETMFSYNRTNKATLGDIISNKDYNPFESMKVMADQIAHLNGAYQMSRHFRESKIMTNAQIINDVERSFLEAIDLYDDDNPANWKVQQRMAVIDGIDNKVSRFDKTKVDGTKLYASTYKQLMELKTELLQSSNLKYDFVEELEMRLEANELSDIQKAAAMELFKIEEGLQDLRYETLQDQDVAGVIVNRIKSLKGEYNAELTDEYGQRIPTEGSDNFHFKPLTSMDFSYIGKTLKFLDYGADHKSRLALAALEGRLFLLDKSVVDHLEKHFFVAKTPSKVEKIFNTVSAQSTKLIMSLAPQLAIRLLKYSASDLGLMGSVVPQTWFHAGPALKEFSAASQSKGATLLVEDVEWKKAHPDSPYPNELAEFLGNGGFNPIKEKGFDVFTMEDKVEAGKILNKYWDQTDSLFYLQTAWSRYSMYRAVKRSFDEGKPLYGTTYYRREAIDALETNVEKAMRVVDDTIGSPHGFPLAAKYFKGWAMFVTYPLALTRTGINGTRSALRVVRELMMGEMNNSGAKSIMGMAVGSAISVAISSALIAAVSYLYNVDEEQEEEWKKSSMYIEPLQTLLNGRPIPAYGNSLVPLQNLKDMYLDPLLDENNKTLLEKLYGFASSTILSKLNPILKTPLELATGDDFYGSSPIPASKEYGVTERLARKLMGYMIGINGANAAFDSLEYSRLAQENPSFFAKLTKSFQNALVAEIGNNKGYKVEQKNYYKTLQMLRGYIQLQYQEDLSQLSTSPVDYADSYALARRIKKAMDAEQKPSVIYGMIYEAIEEGITTKELQSALRTNSISGKLAQIKDINQFYSQLSDKDRIMLDDALSYEENNYGILKTLLEETKNTDTYTKQQNIKRYYNQPRYDSYNPLLPRYNTSGSFMQQPRIYGQQQAKQPRLKPITNKKKRVVKSFTGFTGGKKVKTTKIPKKFRKDKITYTPKQKANMKVKKAELKSGKDWRK